LDQVLHIWRGMLYQFVYASSLYFGEVELHVGGKLLEFAQ
jgi:hypothetical protein